MIKYNCDICKSVIPEDKRNSLRCSSAWKSFGRKPSIDLDLCDKCYGSIIKKIQKIIKEMT